LKISNNLRVLSQRKKRKRPATHTSSARIAEKNREKKKRMVLRYEKTCIGWPSRKKKGKKRKVRTMREREKERPALMAHLVQTVRRGRKRKRAGPSDSVSEERNTASMFISVVAGDDADRVHGKRKWKNCQKKKRGILGNFSAISPSCSEIGQNNGGGVSHAAEVLPQLIKKTIGSPRGEKREASRSIMIYRPFPEEGKG